MGSGPRIVLTRQQARNRPWAEVLRAAGVEVLELPLIRFEPLPPVSDPVPDDPDWILFTSPQAVRAFLEAGLTAGAARLGALGRGTAAALADADLAAEFTPGLNDGVEFATAFTAAISTPATVLLPGPQRRLREPVAILERAGFLVRELPLYRTEPVPAAELPDRPFRPGDVVFLCSPSTVRAFTAAWDERPACVAIGETTASAARAAGFAPRVAETPDLQAMVRAAGLDLVLETPSPESMS